MSGETNVNTSQWNANSVVLIDSPLARAHRRLMLRLGGFTSLVRKDMKILDVGCGSGPFLAFFWSQGYRDLAAIEPDPALTKNIPSSVKVDLRNCMAEKIDFPDASFDVVFVYCVLHHLKGLDAYRAVCAEIHRVLKPGGVVFISEPGRYRVFLAMEAAAYLLGFVSKTFKAFYGTMKEERPEQHFFLKNHNVIRQSLLSKGLRVLKDDYFFYSWIFTAQKP
jgi:SAM-dependent methyltransferase